MPITTGLAEVEVMIALGKCNVKVINFGHIGKQKCHVTWYNAKCIEQTLAHQSILRCK